MWETAAGESVSQNSIAVGASKQGIHTNGVSGVSGGQRHEQEEVREGREEGAHCMNTAARVPRPVH